MINLDGFDQMVKDIARLNGLPMREAERIACLIGDTPEIDDNGNIMVEGRIILLEEISAA